MVRRTIIILSVFTAAVFAGGCSSNRTDLDFRSMTSDAVLPAKYSVRAYIPTDRNTCDVYLSDLPADRLINLADPLTDLAGTVVHFHVFLMPEPGQTPIDASACNGTVQVLVLTGVRREESPNVAGLFAGGGFWLPSSDAGDAVFSGSMLDATLRLARAAPGFTDRLGAARMSGSFDAPRNDDLARALAARIEAVSAGLTAVAK
ncbi:MAG: hypothetical protein AB7G11_00775 [Phycisphaerales bacterium]